jgi:hypothetical protein
VSVGGAILAWPGPKGSAVSGPLDNIIAVGQTIRLPERSRGSKLVFLGAAMGCPARTEGEAMLTYADRTTAPFTLAFGSWAKASAMPLAVRMPYHNGPAGRVDGDTFVYSAEVAIDPGRDVAAFRLPSRVSCGRMHVFAWGFAP